MGQTNAVDLRSIELIDGWEVSKFRINYAAVTDSLLSNLRNGKQMYQQLCSSFSSYKH